MNVRTGNRRLMREVNSKLVMGLIRGSETVSQIELLRKTLLSAGTIASIVKELKGRGFVEEVGFGRSVTGRRPVLLRFNPRAQYVAGIELTAGQTRAALFDLAGQIVRKTDPAAVTDSDPQSALRGACADVLSLAKKAGVPREKLLGVGISVEGIVDPNRERLILSANLGWRNVPVKEIIEARLGVPAMMNNSGGAMGEYLYGAGKGCKSVVCLEIDAGIGAVTVLNGRVVRGAHGMAGEIGHSLAVPDGEACSCGKRGCLETVASAKAIIARVARSRRDGAGSSVPKAIESRPAPEALQLICDAAEKGDPLARRVIDEAGRHLGIAAAAIVNLLDPELVILTGLVAYKSGDRLLKVIRRVAAAHVLQDGSRTIRIEQGTLGERAALVGAAALVCERAFRVPVESDA
ncbi:MAG: ROK family transcriptional regulator [Planctomycetia bacterium]|nr:ROK family transcriptional regulator [Planctomycetia bacterium]